jgi:hypothetical protein
MQFVEEQSELIFFNGCVSGSVCVLENLDLEFACFQIPQNVDIRNREFEAEIAVQLWSEKNQLKVMDYRQGELAIIYWCSQIYWHYNWLIYNYR